MKRINILKTIGICLVVLYVVAALIPVYWVVTTAFKPRVEVYTFPVKYIPSHLTWEPAHNSLTQRPTMSFLRNSLLAAVGATILALALGVPAAYALAREKFPGKKDIAFFILTTRMFPPVTICIPIYFIIRNMGLLDTLAGLIIVYALFNLAIIIWVMKGYIQQVPVEIEESARVDGCTKLGAFIRITLPLLAPGMAAVAIISLVLSWNEFLYALILTHSPAAKTLPVGIAEFIGGAYGILWGEICFLGTVAIIPMIVLILLVQKYIVRGLTMGAIK